MVKVGHRMGQTDDWFISNRVRKFKICATMLFPIIES